MIRAPPTEQEKNIILYFFLLQTLHEQMAASVHEISNLIDPVGVAARSEASQLGHKVKTLLLTQLGGLQWVHTETTAIVVFSFD